MANESRKRCGWVGDDPLMRRYHDREWGVPVRRDRKWFEFLVLEGAQAGLSWRTVLHRREGYRAAFAGFDFEAVARFDARRRRALMNDPGIIRNRLKIESAVTNARAMLEVRERHGSFNAFIWDFAGGRPRVNRFQRMNQVPAVTPEAQRLSKTLKQKGFSFVGPTICYAFMQATGLVNDHLVGCHRHAPLARS